MHLEKRLKEAEKMGFEKIYIPETKITGTYKIQIEMLKNISELPKILS